MMKHVLLVGLGGCIGSIARYKLGGLILHHWANQRLPVSTLAVNVLGCLVAGVLSGLIERHGMFSAEARMFLFTGLLGGFTTFSAFGLESVLLLRRGEIVVAGCYIALSLLLGLSALWLGLALAAGRPPQ